MKIELLKYLECPNCRATLRLAGREESANELDYIEDCTLSCTECAAAFPIVRSLPRFVSRDTYAASFGFPWANFPTLQLDSVMGTDLSRKRFYDCTRRPRALPGARTLEAGCRA